MDVFRYIILIFFISAGSISYSQPIAVPFSEVEQHGISLAHLDSVYQSAMNVDTSVAVFKTDSEQHLMSAAYIAMLQDFGKFLTKNNFTWEKQTKSFNRIYFNEDGKVDYFIYKFLSTDDGPAESLDPAIEKEFNRILNMFVSEYRFGVTAKKKFAQCSPVTYYPKK